MNKFDTSNLDKSIKDLWDELEKLKNDLKNTNENVNNNKERIDTIFPRLDDIIKGYKEGDDNLQRQIDELKNYIDDKIKELQNQLDLFINKPLKGGTKIGGDELKAIQDLIKRVTQIEINFREFVEKARIDDLWKEIEKLKTNKADLTYVNGKYNELNDKYNKHQDEIDYIKKRLEELFSLIQQIQNSILNLGNETGKPIIDCSQYITLFVFNDYKKEIDAKFNKLLSELEDLKNFLLKKIDELAIACNKKFADKNETAKNFLYLEQQIKKILAMLLNKKDENGENWLLAKKPLNGFTCASCEAYIGELKDNGQYIPWNRYPLRDPNDKIYKIGNGFSKMLQMLNFDNMDPNMNLSQGNDNVNNVIKTNNINENLNKNINNNNNKNNPNKSKGRVKSAYVRKRSNNQFQQINNKNPIDNVSVEENLKINHSTINGNNNNINKNINNNNNNNNNFPSIRKNNNEGNFDSSLNEDDEGPKIMKVYKKGK